jgi:hypothetical protein
MCIELAIPPRCARPEVRGSSRTDQLAKKKAPESPQPAYGVGYIRQYAEAIHYDPGRLIERYRAATSEPTSEPPPQEPNLDPPPPPTPSFVSGRLLGPPAPPHLLR